jgi:hypothetical protein
LHRLSLMRNGAQIYTMRVMRFRQQYVLRKGRRVDRGRCWSCEIVLLTARCRIADMQQRVSESACGGDGSASADDPERTMGEEFNHTVELAARWAPAAHCGCTRTGWPPLKMLRGPGCPLPCCWISWRLVSHSLHPHPLLRFAATRGRRLLSVPRGWMCGSQTRQQASRQDPRACPLRIS